MYRPEMFNALVKTFISFISYLFSRKKKIKWNFKMPWPAESVIITQFKP